jgi:hypothetical protein
MLGKFEDRISRMRECPSCKKKLEVPILSAMLAGFCAGMKEYKHCGDQAIREPVQGFVARHVQYELDSLELHGLMPVMIPLKEQIQCMFTRDFVDWYHAPCYKK